MNKRFCKKNISSMLLMMMLLFLVSFLSGCLDFKPKYIWTPEGWQAYKEMLKGTLTTILNVTITGLIPSLFGFFS